MSLTDIGKAICVVWDFPELQTRFVTRNHALLNLPLGWTQFTGAISTPSSGAKFDLTKASLEVGDSEFSITDTLQTVTAWLSTNDSNLSEALVIKRQGLMNEAESAYLVSHWLMEDYSINGSMGGGYKFILTNAFKSMSNAIYEDFDSEVFQLEQQFSSGDTSITLDGVNDDSLFREPGYLIVVDDKTKEKELIKYTNIRGSAFHGVTRLWFGVGASNSVSKDYNIDDTSVTHVWVRRGSPVDVLMEWLTTSDVVSESAVDNLINGDLDDWTASVPDNWSKAGIITEETVIVHTVGGSSAKMDLTTSNPSLATASGDTPALVPGKGYRHEFWAYITDAGNPFETFRLRLRNIDTDKIWMVETQEWIDYSSQFSEIIQVTRFGVWIKYSVSFLVDAAFPSLDEYSVQMAGLQQAGGSFMYLDDVDMIGPYSGRPNGPYDQFDGDGVGVEHTLIDFNQVYSIRDSEWPIPTFNTATGNKETGTAVLFVESEPIDDFKEFSELHLLLPFALKPLVNSKERFTIDRYHNFFPTETTVGDKWLKNKFKVTKWKRNYSKVINNVTIMTDYDVERSKLIHSVQVDHMASVEAYGRSKPLLMENRGGRSGRLSFPEYDSVNDCETAWGRIALELSNPWTQLEITVFYEFRDLSQVDAILLNIPTIPDLVNGVRGMTNQRFFVDSKKIDEEKGFVVLTIRQRRDPFRPALIGPSGMTTYDLELDANHVYAFIGADTPPSFSDDSEVYKVI